MPIVSFSATQARFTGGVARIEIDAERVRELIDAIYLRFPDLTGRLDDLAVAIDDEVHNDGIYLRLERDSEVVFVPRIAGGT